MSVMVLEGFQGWVSGANSADGVEQTFAPFAYETANLSPNLPTASAVVNLVSQSAQDSFSGTGVQSVYVRGLDADFNPVEEWVLLRGTTPVSTQRTFFRINELVGAAFGSSGRAVGAITAYQSSASIYVSEIQIGCKRSHRLQWSLSNRQSAKLLGVHAYYLKDAGLGGSGDLGTCDVRVRYTSDMILNGWVATAASVVALQYQFADSGNRTNAAEQSAIRRLRKMTQTLGTQDGPSIVQLTDGAGTPLLGYNQLNEGVWFPPRSDIFVTMAGSSVASVIAQYGGLLALDIE